jgi:hypothetical protein
VAPAAWAASEELVVWAALVVLAVSVESAEWVGSVVSAEPVASAESVARVVSADPGAPEELVESVDPVAQAEWVDRAVPEEALSRERAAPRVPVEPAVTAPGITTRSTEAARRMETARRPIGLAEAPAVPPRHRAKPARATRSIVRAAMSAVTAGAGRA